MLKAKLDSVRKNKKGFSLVELIIVMAIMVALIAVLAPQFVKYVQRARDSSVSDAAENVYEMVKSEYALGNIELDGTGDHKIVVAPVNGSGEIVIAATGIKAGSAAPADYSFQDACGIDNAKKVKSEVVYTITIGGSLTAPEFTMEKVGTAPTAAADVTVAGGTPVVGGGEGGEGGEG